MGNSVADLSKQFGTEDKPVSASEFMEFWKSLSDDEKDYYKSADLS